MKIADWMRELFGISVIEEEVDKDPDCGESCVEVAPDMLKLVPKEERNLQSRDYSDLTIDYSRMAIEMFAPQCINDCRIMADKLKGGCAVVVNVEYTKTDDARRIYFFMKGCCYALGGEYQQVGNNVFLFSPGCVGVGGLQTELPKSNTFTFSWRK